MQKIISKEIRNEILSKVQKGDRVVDLAKQYGISDKTVYNWIRKSTGEDVISVVKYNRLKRENQELKRLIGELTLTLSLGEKN